eukprot:759635-Hanusia_phi.AAC.1
MVTVPPARSFSNVPMMPADCRSAQLPGQPQSIGDGVTGHTLLVKTLPLSAMILRRASDSAISLQPGRSRSRSPPPKYSRFRLRRPGHCQLSKFRGRQSRIMRQPPLIFLPGNLEPRLHRHCRRSVRPRATAGPVTGCVAGPRPPAAEA